MPASTNRQYIPYGTCACKEENEEDLPKQTHPYKSRTCNHEKIIRMNILVSHLSQPSICMEIEATLRNCSNIQL